MSRYEDDSLRIPPKRRPWLTPMALIVSLGAAGGAGYGAWKFRRENKSAQTELGTARGERQTAVDELGKQKALFSDVDTQLKTCKTDLGASTTELTETKTQLDSL